MTGVTAMLVRPLTALATVFDAYTMFGLPAHLLVDVTLIAHLPTPPRSLSLPRQVLPQPDPAVGLWVS